MKNTVWNIPDEAPIPEALVRAGCTPLLAAVLAQRGITSAEDAAAFLAEGPFEPEDPMALPDMAAAVARLRLAKERNETVAVYGDYDVDGITASCLLADWLRSWGVRTEVYIPDRLEEGYGVNAAAIDKLKEKGVSLIVTVDCGITAVAETAAAAALGVDMIITDHHECQEELPAAIAVVDPKRDEACPCRHLAGVGVAFKLVCALAGDGKAMLEKYADLVAVGTIADVMPLTGENRRIVKQGLQKLRTSPRPGLAALMDQSGVAVERLGANAVGFTLAPRINAAGRLGRVADAAALILDDDPAMAAAHAEALCDMNRMRQQLEADIWDQAAGMLAGHRPGQPIVLAREGWHQGVIGIVASRLSDAWQAPAVMISLDGDRGKGSCRSWGGFNLFDALAACGDKLDSFGGHALAAGLNIRRENIDAFREALCEYYAAHPPAGEEGVSPDLLIADASLLSMECVESLDLLEPCGNGNPRPLFCLRDARLTGAVPIGSGRHTKLQLERFGRRWEAVWFSKTPQDLGVLPGDRVDAAFHLQVSDFRGRRSVQLVMAALRPVDMTARCRDILSGGPIGDYRLTRPEISDLWRRLKAQCPCRVRLSRLGKLDGRLESAQIALGLRVFAELGLANVRFTDEDMDLSLAAWQEKTDLSNSPAWQAQSEQ